MVMEKQSGRSVLTAKQAPHRPGTAPTLGLRAGERCFLIVSETVSKRRSAMWLRELYKRCTGPAANGRRIPPGAASPHSLRPSLEQLEDRTVPSSSTGASFAMPTGSDDSADLHRDVARARQATARYHDLD